MARLRNYSFTDRERDILMYALHTLSIDVDEDVLRDIGLSEAELFEQMDRICSIFEEGD